MIGKKGILILSGFAFALLLLAAPAPAQEAREGESPDMFHCEMCKHVFENMDLIMACQYNVCDFSKGVIFEAFLKKPELMAKFRAFEERDKALSETFAALPEAECKKRLCAMCNAYMGFLRRGLKEERIATPTGTIHISSTKDPKLLADLRVWAAKAREMMADFDAQGAAGGGAATAAGGHAAPRDTGSCASPEGSGATGSSTGASKTVPKALLAEMKKCDLCRFYLEEPDMAAAAKHTVIDLKKGMAVVDTVIDKANLAKYRDFQKRFHGRIDELKKLPFEEARKRLCRFCLMFAELDREGAAMDWNVTPTGTISVITASDPVLVKKIRNFSRMFKAMEKMSPGS